MRHVPAVLRGQDSQGSQTERAYHWIKRSIIELELPPGGPFTEPELAALGGTSKTPVREALVRLQRDGLVEALPRSGYRVTPVTIRDTRELCEFRTLLECEAAKRAASTGLSKLDLKRMGQLVEQTYELTDNKAMLDFMKATLEFDMIIANGCGSDRLASSVTSVFDELERVLRFALRIMPWSPTAASQRRDVLNAITARDPERAERMMRIRCEASQSTILNSLMASTSVTGASIELPVG